MNDKYSQIYDIKTIVLQGNVLGSVLFTLYTADISEDLNILISLYADDHSI